jgi:transposase
MQEKTQVKSLSKEERLGVRRTVHAMWLGGLKAPTISKQTGINLSTVSRWTAGFAMSRPDTPAPEKPRGPAPGKNAALDEKQSRQICRIITDKTPEQLKFGFALWDSDAVRELILRRFAVRLSGRSVRRYLAGWGFTPQRPERAARERDDAAVNRWLDTEYPRIKRAAKRAKAAIYWADETCAKASAHRPRGYAPSGCKPKFKTLANQGCKVNVISAISNSGKARFMLSHKAVNAQVFKTFLSRLMRSCPACVFLIVDNLRVHHAKVLQPWLEKKRMRLRLFYLPSYSPDLNPVEYLNQDMKRAFNRAPGARDKAQLGANVRKHMAKRVRQPKVIRNFVKHKKVIYAA